MPDYQNGKIYKLWSPQGEEIYIGSTTQSLAKRKSQHKENRSKMSYSKILFEKYDDVKIELIEEYPCENRMQLEKREGEHIRNNNCINKVVSGRTHKEYYEENKEYIKYNENNKEKRLAYHKEYYKNNVEKIKEYNENNKEKKSAYYKEWREKNKEKRSAYYKEWKKNNVKKIIN
jgi:hypothetical protein